MRFYIYRDTPDLWIVVGLVLLVVIGIAVYHHFRPPLAERVAGDARYQQALAAYFANLPGDFPTPEERHQALAAATAPLVSEHGVPPEEAGKNLRALVAAADRERSYDLRHRALGYEQAGAYDLAREHFELAASLQAEHDPKDYQFLQRCIARVQAKARKG